MQSWFNIRKAAQVAAYFARAAGGEVNVLKLVKLIYLADRRCMERHEFSLLNDRLVSMPHGPVNSLTYGLIDGCSTDGDDWSEFISDRAEHMVGLARDVTDKDLDEFSRAELAVLADTWGEFGVMTGFELVDWTHEHCQEWVDPDGSMEPIPYERVFGCLGKPAELADRVRTERAIDMAFAADQPPTPPKFPLCFSA